MSWCHGPGAAFGSRLMKVGIGPSVEEEKEECGPGDVVCQSEDEARMTIRRGA